MVLSEMYMSNLISERKDNASALTKTVIEWLFTHKGVKTIRLLSSQGARKLYESQGFIGTDEMVLHRS